MNNRVTFIVSLVCVGIVLFFPLHSRAQSSSQFLFSPSESNDFLDVAQKEVSKLVPNSKILSYTPQKQAALTIFRGATREAILRFLPAFVGTESIKLVIKAASLLQQFSAITIKEVLDEIEKQTVEKAVEIGNAWLFQNEIRTGSGSIENKSLSTTFQYVITFQSTTNDRGNIVIEFYSPDPLVAPSARGSVGSYLGFVGDSPYVGKVAPFIIRIQTQIEKDTWGWAVDSSADTKITVEFPEKVPRLQLAKEWPYPLEEQKIKLLNYWTTAKKILEYLRSTGSEAFGKTADFAHKAQEVVESFINRASQLLSKSGAGLISPVDNEFQQLNALEAQLSLVKDALGVKESEVKLSLAKDEAKTENEPQPVENLARLSFPQESVGSQIVVDEIRDKNFDPAKVRQEILELKGILNSVKDELNPVKQERVPEIVSPVQVGLAQDPQEILDLVKEATQKENVQKQEARPAASPVAWCAIDSTRGPALNTIIFSEIAWMGSINSANDEWMRLKNISSNEVNLAGWQVLDKDKQIAVAFDGTHTVPPQGMFLLERTNNDSLPAAPANLIYTGALSNTDEALYLFDQNCILRDKVVAGPDWLAGDSIARKPMERSSDLGWRTLGSVQTQNSSIQNSFIQTIQQSQGVAGSPPPPPAVTYPKVLISEIQIAGETTKDEFIELYNSTGQAVNLAAWSLVRKTSTGSDANLVSTGAFSGTIGAHGYFLIVPQPNDDGTTNYKGSVTPDLFYSGKTYSVASDNVVFLYNPNGELSDKVGFGTATEAEGSPAPNPPASQSLNRIWDAVSQTYYDRDNNFIDFVLHNPSSPKAQNIEDDPPPEEPPPAAQDTTPPEVTFGALSSSQSNTSFSLSWAATDSGGEASASGVQSIFIEYTVTTSNTGVFAQYDNNGVWTNWQAGSAGKLTLNAQTTFLSIRSQDGMSYTFQVSARDVAGNTSATASASTAVALSKTVVINEIAWMGTTASATDEWVELYNATASPIDLTSWTLAADDGTPSIQLTGTIGALDYFLLERTADTTVSNVSANQIYTGALANEGEYLKLSDVSGSLVDSVDASAAWFNGDNTTKQSMERVSAAQGGSIASNWAKNNTIQHNGKDAGTAIYYGTPGNFINGTPKQANSTVTSPTTISDTGLRFDEFSTITLTLLGSPYLVTGITGIIIPAGKTLIVEPGVQVKFLDNRGYLRVQGTLRAQGTQASGITFTVTDGGAIWCGIKVDSTSTASQLDYVVVDKAGGASCNPGVYAAMYVDSSVVTINNSIIQTGAEYRKLYLKNSNSVINAMTVSGAALNTESVGIYVDGGSPTISNSTISNNSIGIFVNSLSNNPTIQNNTFTGNAKAVKLESAGAVLSGNAASSNTYNGIFVEGITQANTTWQKDSIPYIINKFTVSAGTTLTMQAGVVVKFINLGYTNPELVVQGSLVTQGTLANPVVFTTTSDNTVGGSNTYGGAGSISSWKRIYIAPGSTGSQLTYATLKNGGNTYYEAALYVKQSDVQLSNLTVSNSTQSAIYSSLGTVSGSGVTLINNTYGFHIELGNCPTLSGTNVTTNGGPTLHPSSFPSPPCSF